MAPTATQKYVAEFVGTFGLLLSITGAALLTLGSGVGDDRVLLLSLSLGFGVLGMIYAFGDISGAHFNPAVSVGMFLAGRISAKETVAYIVSQLLGGLVAVALVAGVAHGSAADWTGSVHASLAAQGYRGNGSPYAFALGSVFLLEVILTFFLVTVILMATRAEGFAKNLAPVGIALTLAMTNLIAIPVDGASVNPARSFAPALLSAFFSGPHWAIEQDWLFWVAPILGGAIAALLERVLRP